jgi:hypothetical protein
MKKVDYKSTGKKHENKVPWTSLVATEVANIKKGRISRTSKYWKKDRVHNGLDNIIGDVEEWRAAFKTFCKKKENVLGKKVDRSQLLKYSYRNFQC